MHTVYIMYKRHPVYLLLGLYYGFQMSYTKAQLYRLQYAKRPLCERIILQYTVITVYGLQFEAIETIACILSHGIQMSKYSLYDVQEATQPAGLTP